MKKVLLLGMLLVVTSSFAEMEVERGYGNVEFSASYKYTSSNLKEFNVLKELHKYEENQNDFLFYSKVNCSFDKAKNTGKSFFRLTKLASLDKKLCSETVVQTRIQS